MTLDLLKKGVVFCRMIKIEHSIFALPFAYMALFLAARGWPGLAKLFWISVAMVAVRSWAMAINRLSDVRFDRLNPRTKERPLVTGELSLAQALGFSLITGMIFVLACAALNKTCLYLSPVALAWSALYSFSKRFTWLCHFWLGSVLGLAPLGGWLAYSPDNIGLIPVLLFWGVLFWVAGFDIIYSSQDRNFDLQHGLHSVPVRFGLGPGFTLSTFAHFNAALFFALAGWAAKLGTVFWLFWLGTAVILLAEHFLVSADHLERVDLAFFTLNGLVAVALCLGVIFGIFV